MSQITICDSEDCYESDHSINTMYSVSSKINLKWIGEDYCKECFKKLNEDYPQNNPPFILNYDEIIISKFYKIINDDVELIKEIL